MSKNRRGVVLATTRQCLWKCPLEVIGPFLPKRYTRMLSLYAASRRAGAARPPRNLRWNPVRFRLALVGMMKVFRKTTTRRIPDTAVPQHHSLALELCELLACLI